MAAFDKYSEPNDKGFTNKSAFRILRGIGTTVKDKIIQQQFDLAQMTVIDEMHGSDEYADMEFVELLEFLVRYAYVASQSPISVDPDDINKDNFRQEPIHKKLKHLLEQILALVDIPYVEPL